jgi:hypothetical protein
MKLPPDWRLPMRQNPLREPSASWGRAANPPDHRRKRASKDPLGLPRVWVLDLRRIERG